VLLPGLHRIAPDEGSRTGNEEPRSVLPSTSNSIEIVGRYDATTAIPTRGRGTADQR
jgi:hypothetical protein